MTVNKKIETMIEKINLFYDKIYLSILTATYMIAFYSSNANALSAGVVIPCYDKHFQYLPLLLKSLTLQTYLPKQVIISLSQIENLVKEEVDELESSHWPFELKIIPRLGYFGRGPNRTLAAKSCDCDIIFCIDADDIPHPQRIEAALQLFEAVPEAMGILTGHAYPLNDCRICEKSIPVFTFHDFISNIFYLGSHTWKQLVSAEDFTCWKTGVTNGVPCLRRTLFELEPDLCWSEISDGEDVEFNMNILKRGYSYYLIQLPLYLYYNKRSSPKRYSLNRVY